MAANHAGLQTRTTQLLDQVDHTPTDPPRAARYYQLLGALIDSHDKIQKLLAKHGHIAAQ